MTIPAVDLERSARDPAAFIDRFIRRNELNQPFALMPHQREVLRLAFPFDADGRLPWSDIVFSCVKKSGKTTIDAMVTLWFAFTQEAPNDVKLCANDQEQSISRTFTTIKGLLKFNPELGTAADVRAQAIILANGTTITALANDYAGEAGANQGWSSWTELWAYTSESSRRLWEELTPVPTRRNSVRFVDTCAGFEGESVLLRQLYLLGVAPDAHPDGEGERLHPELPIYGNRAARLFVYWDHEPRMPWQTASYYAGQRRALRPSTYLRLHENRWTTAESVFLTPELWDPSVDPSHRPSLFGGGSGGTTFVGVDAATKRDTLGVAAVRWAGDRLELAWHRIWTPSPGAPVDLESSVEAFLRERAARERIHVVFDPFQMARSAATLRRDGIRIDEYPQTPANLTLAGQALFDLLRERRLRLYPSEELRRQALNTIAIETPRGFRIAREKASRKIDAIVALAMACAAAIGTGNRSTRSVAAIMPEGDSSWQDAHFGR